MVGGDLPGWLPTLFRRNGATALTDRRGECVYAGCPHYRKCFIERAARASAEGRSRHRQPRAGDGQRRARARTRRRARPVCLRRGPSSVRRRRFDVRRRADRGRRRSSCAAGSSAPKRAGAGGGAGWRRACPTSPAMTRRGGARSTPRGRCRTALPSRRLAAAARRRASRSARSSDCSPRCAAWSMRAPTAAARMRAMGWRPNWPSPMPRWSKRPGRPPPRSMRCVRPLVALGRRLEAVLEEAPDWLDGTGARADRRCDRLARLARGDGSRPGSSLLARIGGPADPDFVDWLAVDRSDGRECDMGLHRHWLDPTRPSPTTVLQAARTACWSRPRHCARAATGTLADAAHRGASICRAPPSISRRRQPVRLCRPGRGADRHRREARRPVGAGRRLWPADRRGGRRHAGAVHRDPAAARRPRAHRRPAGARGAAAATRSMSIRSIPAHWSISSATIRAPRCSAPMPCATGSTCRAIRCGWWCMEGVPWPKPSVLHAARRMAGGGTAYDDRIVRARLAQAFGRLIRRADDRGHVSCCCPPPAPVACSAPSRPVSRCAA